MNFRKIVAHIYRLFNNIELPVSYTVYKVGYFYEYKLDIKKVCKLTQLK